MILCGEYKRWGVCMQMWYKLRDGSSTLCCKYVWLNHFRSHYVFHNPKMISESAATKLVIMVVLKYFLLASNEWKRSLYTTCLTSMKQSFHQCVYLAALLFYGIIWRMLQANLPVVWESPGCILLVHMSTVAWHSSFCHHLWQVKLILLIIQQRMPSQMLNRMILTVNMSPHLENRKFELLPVIVQQLCPRGFCCWIPGKRLFFLFVVYNMYYKLKYSFAKLQ